MCKLSPLASRGPFRLDVCEECQCVHLHLGAVSIRLDEAALGALADVLSEARGQRHEDQRIQSWGWERGIGSN